MNKLQKFSKAVIVIAVLLVFSIGNVFAVDVDQMIETAKENSDQYQSIENSLIQSQNNYKLQSVSKNGAGITVNVGKSNVVSDGDFYFPAASVSVSLPEFVDGLSIKADASVDSTNRMNSGITVKDGASYTIGADASYSKTIDFTGSGIQDINDIKTLVQMQVNYEKSVLNFENSLINDLVTIMQTESQLEKTRTSYEKSLTTYNNSIKLGDITEGSLSDLKQQMSLESSRLSLESSEERLEELKESFFHNYGIEYDEVTVSREADLSFEPSEDGNSTVYLAKLSLISAEDKLDSALGKASSLTVSGSLGSDVVLSNEKTSVGADASAGLTFTSGNLSLSTSVSSSLKDGKVTSPTVTVQGSWGTSQSSNVNTSNLNIAYLDAQSSYDDALYDYKKNVKDMESSIASYEAESKQLELTIEYDQKVLEAKQTLFAAGLCTQSDLDDALSTVETDEVNLTIQKLKGLILENQIKMLEL